MKNSLLFWSSVFGLTAVILGAFGAHELTAVLSEEQLHVFQTGVTYQFYHSLALLGCAVLSSIKPTKWIHRSGRFFIAGIFLFCGSLYLLAIPGIAQVVGIITPLGGLCFIAGWTCLLVASFKKNG